MKFILQAIRLMRSGTSTKNYYGVMNNALKRISGEYTMLHYPYYRQVGESFIESQQNLTDYCISLLNGLENKKVLEIGCGNGIQASYILEKYNPEYVTGIDLSRANIKIANQEKRVKNLRRIFFLVDDAQKLTKIKDNSFDVVISIESAFHYPDKPAFLKQIGRVLKPNGAFLIADILTTRPKKAVEKNSWKPKMLLHHWRLDTYLGEFEKARLAIDKQNNITPEVIKGFRNYKYWMRSRIKSGFFGDLIFYVFYWINIKLNIYLLKKRRQYYVFTGTKKTETKPLCNAPAV